MRPEKNPLDLNNLPEDYLRDGKQVFEESSSAGHRKKKSGAKDGKDECGKVYECRFCSLKFCKSQALGGHMNRHRQERETETLNKARQLVFHNDHNLPPQAPPHLGCHQITPAGSYHPAGHIGDPFRSMYPPRLFSASPSTIISSPPPPPQPPQYPPYPSPTRLSSYASQYPPPPPNAAMNEYYVGHVLSSSPHSQYPPPHHAQNLNNYMGAAGAGAVESNYTCIGAPVGHGFVAGAPGSSRGSDHMAGGSSSGGGRDGSLSNIQQEEGLNWGRRQRSLDHTSSINRFQDGF